MVIVVDQLIDFKNICLFLVFEDLERFCKYFGVLIDVLRFFVCFEQLKDLFVKEKFVKIKFGLEIILENEFFIYDMIDDMLQVLFVIVVGLVEGVGVIIVVR